MNQMQQQWQCFWCNLNQENCHGASGKNTLVYRHFLNDYKEKTNIFWCPEMLAMCAILWCMLRYEKRLEMPIAQAGAEWCISKKTQNTAFYWLGQLMFPIEFDHDFLTT